MIPAIPWHGAVDTNGKLALNKPREFRQFLEQFKNEPVVVTVAKPSRQRSVRQNSWLWGVAYPVIAEYCGNDAHEHEQLHYDLLSVRFGTKAVSPLVPGAPPRIVPARTSSELSTKEMSDYMEWLVRYAATEFSVRIPLPDDPPEDGSL